MKTNLNNIFRMVVLGMSLLTMAAPLWAGSVAIKRVSITNSPTGRSAIGTMVGARYSTNSPEFIGCQSSNVSASTLTVCYAKDTAGQYLFCGSNDAKFAEAVHAMTESSQISFGADLGGSCTVILVYQGSDLLQ